MNIETFRECCLRQPLATEDMPFDDTVVVFRLQGKIFACIPLDRPDIAVLKCDPEYALELRERYPAIEGARHWNRKYWNQIHLDRLHDDELLVRLVRHSWLEVNRKLPLKLRIPETDI